MRQASDSIPSNLQGVLDAAVERLRAAGTDLQSVEVKQAAGGLPSTALESVCAFANAAGGLLILGLTDGDFSPVDIDAAGLAAHLASACSDGLAPAVRPEIDIASMDGRPVVVARVEALEYQRRPCHLLSKGMDRGSYLRTHDGDRRLNSYEVHVMVSGRGQPAEDETPVERSGIGDLDPRLTQALLQRLRETRGAVFAQSSDEEVLHMMGVIAEPGAESAVTLAGLLALGRFPQRFLPQLAASFVVLPTVSGEPMADGTRFLDNQPLDGPIPMVVSGALDAMRRNMRRRSVVVGAGREDSWDYPIEAVREIVANALMHRDYHPSAHGSQVRIALFPDRFEVCSAGGLHGANAGRSDVDELIRRGVTATRNARLAKLLEDVVIPDTGRPVCENRGSGLRAAVAALRRAGLSIPVITDDVSELRVVVHDRRARPSPRPLSHDGTSVRIPGGREHDPWPHDGVRPPTRRGTLSSADAAERVPRLSRREREIIDLLAGGSRSSSELAGLIGISQQAILRWLNQMADRGLVRSTEPTRKNRRNRWELNFEV